MRSSIIPSRWLGETGRRLDPGPYLSGAIEAKETLRVLKVRKSPLSTLTMNGEAGIFHAGELVVHTLLIRERVSHFSVVPTFLPAI